MPDALPFQSRPPGGLDALRRRVRHDLDTLAYPAADWVRPAPAAGHGETLDCAIIGAGQYGLTLAHGLIRERITNVAAFDTAPAGREGPWVTFARMTVMRTPKHLTGPDLGIPSLSFRVWWEAQHGEESWDALFRIPRTAWMDYLNWYRDVLDLPVRNAHRLVALDPAGDAHLRLTFETPDGEHTLHARTVILATGADGTGRSGIPESIAAAVPADRLHHANDPFDPAALRGMRVGILGNGASAFDAAIAALEAGAVSADLCFRRPDRPRTNPRRWMENAGTLAGHADLPDARKWAVLHRLEEVGQGPPQPTYDRALATPGFTMHPATPWEDARWTGDEIVVTSGAKTLRLDAVIVATGMSVDLSHRPELATVARHAALWSDRFAPPSDQPSDVLGRYPYLDRHGTFTERTPGEAPWLSRVLTIARGATLSLGPVHASNSGMKYAAPRLIEAVRRRLFLDQDEAEWDALLNADHVELRDPVR